MYITVAWQISTQEIRKGQCFINIHLIIYGGGEWWQFFTSMVVEIFSYYFVYTVTLNLSKKICILLVYLEQYHKERNTKVSMGK